MSCRCCCGSGGGAARARCTRIARPAAASSLRNRRASSVFARFSTGRSPARNAVAIAGTKLRPKATALVEVATNFNDPTYCEGVAIKILGFAGLKKQDWFSDSDPYVKLTAKSSYGNVIKSKKGKEHPRLSPCPTPTTKALESVLLLPLRCRRNYQSGALG